MKTRTLVAIAMVLSLATAASVSASGWWRVRDIRQIAFGSNFVIPQDSEQPNRGFLFLQARGNAGRAKLDVMSEFQALAPIPECPAGQVGVIFDQVFFTQTFRDGSMVSGITQDEGTICTADGQLLTFEAHGEVRHGTGRYEGVTGTWNVVGETNRGTIQADMTIDFD